MLSFAFSENNAQTTLKSIVHDAYAAAFDTGEEGIVKM